MVTDKDRIQKLENLSIALNESSIMAYTTPQGVITEVNDKFCEVSGYSREELLGKTHRMVCSSYHSKEFFAELWVTIASGHVWKGEICNRTKSGDIYWVDTTIVPFKDTEGVIYSYLAIRHEITGHKESLQALNTSEAHFNAMFDSSVDGIVLLDKSNKIIKINTAGVQILSVCPVTVIGRDFTDFTDTFSWDELNKSLRNNRGELKAYDATGNELDLFVTLTEMVIDGESFQVMVMRNIADQKSRDERLEKMGEQLDVQVLFNQRLSALAAMAAGIAHELNQPLSGIRVYADMINNYLENDMPLSAELMNDTMTKIVNLVDRASGIIEHMREFSSEQRPTKSLPDKCNLRYSVERSLHLVGQQLKNKGIEFFNEVHEDHVIQADSHRIEQVLINLFSNARDSIEDKSISHGEIKVSSVMRGNAIEMLISDNGGGIPKDLREKVFEPFFTTKSPGRGTGLGLAICHGILKDYKSQISLVKSDEHGTVFKIMFKRAN
jgi:PAS domain S-box-containing protein